MIKEENLLKMNLQLLAESDDKTDGKTDDKSDDKTDDKSEGTKNDKSDGGEKEEKTFTQKQVNAMMSKEKKQGRAAAFSEFGIDPNDKKTIAAFKAFIEAGKTEEEKAKEQEIEKTKELDDAKHRTLVAETKAEIMIAGVAPQFVEDATTIVLGKMTEDSDPKSLVGELKNRYPMWFNKNDEEGTSGTGSSLKDKTLKKDADKPKGLGARLAASKKASTSKKSVWGNN